ncbi:SpaH/EbpB family LPXTG-anchored major pilin [Enterococcus pallens]|uniref:Fimbrial isopeptide formation D2 domain-containing protein n=1 Tax=Enterococcus pallens ATCC BAA-351 TaxID=1158607 RepID=R2SFK2_9ENTE|nr:SpaH/EbpB family LPXTG-anchored major pilin [Enterococcus pallens]EOH91696.1 fimbrial isopeptide formation D2 domain-containing protein [Enterococcus pallens ATCC BAA-351]EOU25124.1 hypothetical protein I588_01112 [Enterococcus pallens ATCC BAA-351]
MKKKLKKIVALLFVGFTLVAGGLQGVAEDTTQPQPRPEKGNLFIHKHWADDKTPIGNEGDGTEILNPGISNPAIKGVQFDVWLLTPDSGAPAIPPSDKDGWTYSRNGTSLTVSKAGKDYTYTLTPKQSDIGANGKTNEHGLLKYSNLDAGYYYVEENLGASTGYQVQGVGNEDKTIASGARPFIVAVPMTTPDGTGWNKNVHVYPKNVGLDPEKTSDKETIMVGDTVKWTIRANVPSDFETYSRFEVTDILDARLDYAGDSSVIVAGTNSGGGIEVTLTAGDDYNIAYTGADRTLKISLTAKGIAKLATAADVTKITISFDTKVNGNINNGKDDENIIENEATIEFENEHGTDSDQTPKSKVWTGEIKVDKTYTGVVAELKGRAEFQLAATEDDAGNAKYLKVVLDKTNSYIVAILEPDGSFTDVEGTTTAYADAKDWVMVPNTTDLDPVPNYGLDGNTFYVPSFEGLLAWDDKTASTSYWLVETKTAEGYNLLDAPKKITFVKDGTTEKYVITEPIKNSRGFTLPKTGGVGTLLLTVIGIVLVGLAIIFNLNKKKGAHK